MNSIHKYPVEVGDEIAVSMPIGATILHLDMQLGVPCIWALVDTSVPLVIRRFRWRGTGHDCEGIAAEDHVGTIMMHSGRLVFHLFQVKP